MVDPKQDEPVIETDVDDEEEQGESAEKEGEEGKPDAYKLYQQTLKQVAELHKTYSEQVAAARKEYWDTIRTLNKGAREHFVNERKLERKAGESRDERLKAVHASRQRTEEATNDYYSKSREAERQLNDKLAFSWFDVRDCVADVWRNYVRDYWHFFGDLLDDLFPPIEGEQEERPWFSEPAWRGVVNPDHSQGT